MEATALSVGKSVLSGALGYAKSAIAEEVALQLGIQRDHAFIRDELEMMLAFLMAAHDEQDKHQVVKTWVKQVRDVAYDAEDSLQDFAVRLGKPSWWRILRKLLDGHNVAKQMKELRAKVEDVSQRNQRYQLILGSGSKDATSTEQSNMADATMFGIKEARRQQEKAKVDLSQLISNKLDKDLKVIAVWGTSGVPGQTAVIKRAYDDLKRSEKFEFYAWIRIMHSSDPTEFLQCIMRQFYIGYSEVGKIQEEATRGAQVLKKMGTMSEDDLVDEFHKQVSLKSYLIVLNDLSTIEEWDWIKTYFPDNKKGCRIIVSTEQNEVASFCLFGQENLVLELKQSSADHSIYAFCDKGKDGTDLVVQGPSSNTVPANVNNNSAGAMGLTRTETMMAAALKVSQLIGREKEKQDIIKQLQANADSKQLEVITICGMGGLGKTTLVKYIYQSQELSAMFDKRACVTIKRPFIPSDLLSSLLEQLCDKEEARGDKTEPRDKLASLLAGKRFLIVIDDLLSTTEWDNIKHFFLTTETSRIIITTREEKVAKHCSQDYNICKIKLLEGNYSCDLFTEKVFGKITNLDEHYPELAEEAKLILKKCSGLPLAIVTIGGFLSKQPKTPMEWKKLNEQIGAELEINQDLGTIKDVLIKSYDGLPYHLKSCFLYMSIFPEDHNISRRRLVRRWIAEGYSSGVRGKFVKETADSYFMDLIDRSMIMPFKKSIGSRNGIDSCRIHDLMREISVTKSMDENLVFRMEEGCSANTVGTTRHLSISSNWEGDRSEFESVVDLSRIRSLTVFGRWRPFFISDKMRLLRVLDLEGTSNLFDHHLMQIGMLVHLKYLSLRGCGSIFHLPNSLGNLKQLQTLDIYGTRILKLPQCITKLRKLQYICAGGTDFCGTYSFEKFVENNTDISLLQNKIGICALISMAAIRVACCNRKFQGHLLEKNIGKKGDSNRRDVCTWYCHAWLPFLTRLAEPGGIVVPRGIRKLKALHTLNGVNIARGKSILQEIKCLVQLRKLEVTGINKKNCQEFCSILAALSFLESLSVTSFVESGLHGCLDGVSSPPKSLQSLKIYGKLVQLPEWIGGLQNLVKLKLKRTELSVVDGTMQVLGKLPNLAILRLLGDSFGGEECLHLIFHREAPFSSLMALELRYVCRLDSVVFGEGATPKLELLHFCGRVGSPDELFSGLASLPKLKEFVQDNKKYTFEADVQVQLSKNTNGPIFKKY